MIYSKSTGGFYPLDMKAAYVEAGTWPTDGVAVTTDEHAALMSAQTAGKLIKSNGLLAPLAVDRPAPTLDELSATDRAKRNALLTASDWTQLADVPDVTKSAWQTYRQALRDLTKQSGFPTTVVWPVAPT